MPARAQEPPLLCPRCAAAFSGGTRFCPDCRLPLVLAPGPEEETAERLGVSERHRRARMVKPQLSEGELVKVAWARNQPEAEFIQGLLLEEGVPSMVRRSAGFDVPDFMAAGPRDVLVPVSGADVAREVLLQSELDGASPPDGGTVSPRRLLVGLVLSLAAGALVIWLISLAVR